MACPADGGCHRLRSLGPLNLKPYSWFQSTHSPNKTTSHRLCAIIKIWD